MKDLLQSGWTHVVLNYLGPEDGQGIVGYFNGVQGTFDRYKSGQSFSTGDGRVVVGRYETDRDRYYAGVDLDELLFFNQKLSIQEIMDIVNIG